MLVPSIYVLVVELNWGWNEPRRWTGGPRLGWRRIGWGSCWKKVNGLAIVFPLSLRIPLQRSACATIFGMADHQLLHDMMGSRAHRKIEAGFRTPGAIYLEKTCLEPPAASGLELPAPMVVNGEYECNAMPRNDREKGGCERRRQPEAPILRSRVLSHAPV